MKIKVKTGWCFKRFKTKEQTKLIQDKSKNQPKATIILNELINDRKKIMSKLYDSIDYNNLKFEYVGLTKDVSFMNIKILKNFLMQ